MAEKRAGKPIPPGQCRCHVCDEEAQADDEADLHVHTTASDGTWTPQELITEAQKIGLGALAVTDHDSIANVAEAGRLAKLQV